MIKILLTDAVDSVRIEIADTGRGIPADQKEKIFDRDIESSGTMTGGDVQFNMWFTDADSISGDSSPTFIDKGSLKNKEFQTALYLTYTYELGADSKIVPYLGGYYSQFLADIDDSIRYQNSAGTTYTHGDMEEEDNFGMLAGMNVLFSENMSLNLEGRFIAETAATVGASYKF